jgi:hypothetical protein
MVAKTQSQREWTALNVRRLSFVIGVTTAHDCSVNRHRPLSTLVASVIGGLLVWGGAACSGGQSSVGDSVAQITPERISSPVTAPAEVEAPEPAPSWEQSPSPADFSRCQLADPRSEFEKLLSRGEDRDGVRGRASVGFPRTELDIPAVGESNVIAALVSFTDAPPPADMSPDYLRLQTDKISDWSDYWSQGRFRYSFQVVEDWVQVPINSQDFVLDPGAPDNHFDHGEVQKRLAVSMRTVAQAIVDELPSTLDFQAADAIYLYFSPTTEAFKIDLTWKSEPIETPQGPLRIPLWGGGSYHLSDAGLPYEVKKEHLWSFWIHELLHSQGQNLHAPGNGWSTGIGQNPYPRGTEFSGALAAWDQFQFGWIDEEQVFCADLNSIGPRQEVILTPQEIPGGVRKMIAVRTIDHKVLVVESRRPTGYSKDWFAQNSGLLVYEVDADGEHYDHVPDDCGNDPLIPKWARYLPPDGQDMSGFGCSETESVIVKEGMSVTSNGVKVTLEFSDLEADYVSVELAAD